MTMLENDLAEVTGAIWESLFGIPVEEVAPPAGPTPADAVTASVSITGEWHGTLAMTFPAALGRRLASRMFRLPEDRLGDDLLGDAVGELANIAGGNVKGMLDGDTELSLPTVGRGPLAPTDPTLRPLCECAFACAGEVFVVALHVTPTG